MATDVFMEGLSIPFLKLCERGKINETLMAMIRANTRLPVETEGDVYSLVGLQRHRRQAPVEMMAEFGLDDLDELGSHICDRSRSRGARRDRASCRAAAGPMP